MVGLERERCAAAPAAHQLGGQPLLVSRRGCVPAEEGAEACHVLVELAPDQVGTVVPQARGLWRGRQFVALIRVAEDELPGVRTGSWPGSTGRPLPAMAGWLMPSR